MGGVEREAAENRQRVDQQRKAEGSPYRTVEEVEKLSRALQREKGKRREARQELVLLRESVEVAIESLRALLPEDADAARERELREEIANLRAEVGTLKGKLHLARSATPTQQPSDPQKGERF